MLLSQLSRNFQSCACGAVLSSSWYLLLPMQPRWFERGRVSCSVATPFYLIHYVPTYPKIGYHMWMAPYLKFIEKHFLTSFIKLNCLIVFLLISLLAMLQNNSSLERPWGRSYHSLSDVNIDKCISLSHHMKMLPFGSGSEAAITTAASNLTLLIN